MSAERKDAVKETSVDGKEQSTSPSTLLERFKVVREKVNWKPTHEENIYSRPWMSIFLVDYEKANGTEVKEFVKVESSDYVEILPFDPKTGELVLIAEYARGKGEPHIKLPAGKIKKGQEPLDAAKAELREETGLEGSKTTIYAKKYGIPMWYSAKAYFAFAEVNAAEYSKQLLDKNEEIIVLKAPVKEVVDLVVNDKIDDLELSFAVLLAIQKGLIPREFTGLEDSRQ